MEQVKFVHCSFLFISQCLTRCKDMTFFIFSECHVRTTCMKTYLICSVETNRNKFTKSGFNNWFWWNGMVLSTNHQCTYKPDKLPVWWNLIQLSFVSSLVITTHTDQDVRNNERQCCTFVMCSWTKCGGGGQMECINVCLLLLSSLFSFVLFQDEHKCKCTSFW